MMDLPDGAIQKINPARPFRPPVRGDDIRKSSPESDQAEELKIAARAFEAYFIQTLLKEMRKTQAQGGIFGEGAGKEIYQSLFDEKIAQKMTESGGIGLSEIIIKKLANALKNSGEATDRREAINTYAHALHNVTVGVRDEDTRK